MIGATYYKRHMSTLPSEVQKIANFTKAERNAADNFI